MPTKNRCCEGWAWSCSRPILDVAEWPGHLDSTKGNSRCHKRSEKECFYPPSATPIPRQSSFQTDLVAGSKFYKALVAKRFTWLKLSSSRWRAINWHQAYRRRTNLLTNFRRHRGREDETRLCLGQAVTDKCNRKKNSHGTRIHRSAAASRAATERQCVDWHSPDKCNRYSQYCTNGKWNYRFTRERRYCRLPSGSPAKIYSSNGTIPPGSTGGIYYFRQECPVSPVVNSWLWLKCDPTLLPRKNQRKLRGAKRANHVEKRGGPNADSIFAFGWPGYCLLCFGATILVPIR